MSQPHLAAVWCLNHAGLHLQDLNLEQKVKLLQREHPSVPAAYLAHALEASSLDLSLATALVLTAEDGHPTTPDAEARPATTPVQSQTCMLVPLSGHARLTSCFACVSSLVL